MPGLPFTKMPAAKPSDETTPFSILDSELENLKGLYGGHIKTLQGQFEGTAMDEQSVGQYNRALGSLQAEYDGEKNAVMKKQQQLQLIQKFVTEGSITPQAGEEAMWRMVLPGETERAMFQKPEQELGTPYSIPSIEKIEVEASEFAEQAEWDYDPWLTVRDVNKPKTTESLILQYKRFRRKLGYDFMKDPAKKRHIDTIWDATMAGNKAAYGLHKATKSRKATGWDPNAPEIKSLRTVGKLGQAAGKRMTPFGAAVAGAKPENNQPPTRDKLLRQYRKLGGSKTKEGRAFADRNLK